MIRRLASCSAIVTTIVIAISVTAVDLAITITATTVVATIASIKWSIPRGFRLSYYITTIRGKFRTYFIAITSLIIDCQVKT